MYQLTVESSFSAAHYLRGYKGKCENLHGHNWRVSVTLERGSLNGMGMVIDFKELKEMVDKVLEELDHKFLNELPSFRKANPTTENIAKTIYGKLSKLLKDRTIRLNKVTVWEKETSSATYHKGETDAARR